MYKKSKIKFSSELFLKLAKFILIALDSPYTNKSRDSRHDRHFINKLSPSWIHHFMAIHNVVLLLQPNHLTCNPKVEKQIEMTTAYNLEVSQ